MKLKGSVEINIVDSQTGRIKQTIKKSNLITNTALLSVLFWGTGNFFGSKKISISTSTNQPSITNSNVSNIIATGYVPNGVTSPTWNGITDPPFGQVQNRVDFIGSDRTFRTVALTDIGSSNNQNASATAFAYLLLDTPCTQGAYDYLDIFYRIQFLNFGGQGFNRTALLDFGAGNFGVGFRSAAFNISTVYASICNSPTALYTDLFYGEDTRVGYDFQFNRIYGWLNPVRVDSHYKFKMILQYGLNGGSIGSDLAGLSWTADVNGWIFNSILRGTRGDGRGVYNCSQFSNSSSPFQNLFSHSADATVPFFDSLKLASGNGKVLLSGTWQNKLPELYKVTIIDSGVTGIAKYKWSVRKHLGFNSNTYNDRSVNCPFRNPNTPAASRMHGWRDENNDVLRYSNTQVVQYDDTGVTLLDIFDGLYTDWDATTTPALPVTQARQCAVDTVGKKIYVACRNTGLWIIDVTTNTITNPYNVGCYGVDVGRNGVAYFVINGGLYSSANFSTPLNFTYAGISDNNWSKVYYLKADPEHLEDRLAIVMQPPTAGNRRVVWHRITPSIIASGEFRFDSFADENGLCYWIGTNYGTQSWTNPHTAGRATVVMSSIGAGTHANMVNRQGGQNNHTQNNANSWIAIDLGAGNTLTPNYYILQQRGQGSEYAIRNWKFQGSNNAASNSVADLNNATWTDLDVRVNDTSMGTASDAWAGYTANASLGYRWLRILQTGVNSSGDNHLILGEFEFYGTFSSTTTSRVPPSRLFNQTVTGVESSSLKPWSAAMDVSDTGSFWVDGNLGKLNYGSAFITTLNTSLCSQQLTHSVWGSDRYFKVAFYKNFLIGRDKIVNDAAVVQNTYTSFGDKAFLIHLDGGIALTNREMRQMFTDNSYCWENYGWDGTKWVLNGTTARTTHTDEQSLGNGITIKFQDGTSAPHFTATDYYTQGICYGTWKDNASSIFYESCWYSKPARFGISLPDNFTIPATAPYKLKIPVANEPGFITIEIDSPELNQFKINNQPITTLYVSGTTPPAPNEIRLYGNGDMEFNAADAGKVVSGTFSYVKD